VVAAPLAVVVGLNEPQLPAGVHDQLTFPFELLLTAATAWNVPPTITDDGGAVTNETATGNGGPFEPELPHADKPSSSAARKTRVSAETMDDRPLIAFITGLPPARGAVQFAQAARSASPETRSRCAP